MRDAMRMRTASRQLRYRSAAVLTALRLLLAVGTFVHCAVEGLVDCLVLWLVTNTSLPAPGFAFGLIASAHKASVTPRIGLLVRAVLTFPEIYEVHVIYKSYCGMLAHPMMTQYTLLAHPVMTQHTLLANQVMTQYTLLADPVMTVQTTGRPGDNAVHAAGTPGDDSTNYWQTR